MTDTYPYLINLEKRTDRLKNMVRRLALLGLDFELFKGIEPLNNNRFPNKGHHGCALSHLEVWKKGLIDHNGQNILVFEDDALLRDDFTDLTNDALKCLLKTDWHVLYLGCKIANNKKQKKFDENVYFLERGYHFHSYVLNGVHLKYLIERFEKEYKSSSGDNIPIDILVNNFPEIRKFFVNPILSIQVPDYTDIENREMNRLDEYFGYFDREEFKKNCQEFKNFGF